MFRLFRRFLDLLARHWDALDAARVAQRLAEKYRRAYRREVFIGQRQRRELESQIARLRREREGLQERMAELSRENDARQAKIDILDSQVELAGAYNELNRAILDTDIAKLAAERAAALRKRDGEQR